MFPELVVPLVPVLLGDVVVDVDEDEGSYRPKGIKVSEAINGQNLMSAVRNRKLVDGMAFLQSLLH
jgi:hypothetical protein